MKTQIPIYRAKKKDSDEFVEGDLIKKISWFYIAIQDVLDSNNAYDLLTFQGGEFGNIFEIDPSTIEISFNNGQKWLKIDRVVKLMEDQVNCTICNDKGINHNYQPRPNKYKSIPCDCGAKQ